MLSAEVRRKSPASPAESLREVAHSLALGELPALGELGTEGVWTFGYGSNMNMQALRSKKKIRVFEEAAATVVGWRRLFNLPGTPYVEPAYANAVRSPGNVLHGVAVRIDAASRARLDRMEASLSAPPPPPPPGPPRRKRKEASPAPPPPPPFSHMPQPSFPLYVYMSHHISHRVPYFFNLNTRARTSKKT